MLDTSPEVGSAANRYEVLAKLATGGMAEIFLARTRSSAGVERYVVLKRVLKHRATDIKFVHMFLDEARLAAQLQHPNIAQVFDTGKLGDSYFFTMEYVHGETVRELLHRSFEQSRPIPISCTVTIIAGAAAALQHAHDRIGHDGKPLGIVHRDVSPSNLIVSYEGNVKIVDFGVAKAAHRSVETQSGTVKGKMGYMAPEQCRGGEVDRRCDLFSLGIVMWELLVGERLFKRNTDFESMEAVVREPTPPPSSLRPEIPAALDAIVLKLLAKAPRDRYQTANEMLDDLELVAGSSGVPISVAGVRRYLRELFGQPHEPWVELRRGDKREEAVTVTGAPVNGRPDMLELEGDALDRLADLSVSPRDTMPVRAPRVSTTTYSGPPEEDEEQPARPRRSLTAVLVVGGALAVGAITLFLATRTVASDEPPESLSVVVARDAAIAVESADARAVAQAPRDAAVTTAVDADSSESPSIASIASLVAARRYKDAVSACEQAASRTPDEAFDCTIAACNERARDQARVFVAQVVRSKQRELNASCARLGTTLVSTTSTRPPGHGERPHKDPVQARPPPTIEKVVPTTGKRKPDCNDPDPMACRQ